MWLGWLEYCPIYQKVAGLIPSQGTYLGCRLDPRVGHIWEATNWCFSHKLLSLSLSPPHLPPSLPTSLFLSKTINISLGENLKSGRSDVSNIAE